MKKVIAVILMALCIVSLCACGEKAECEHTFSDATCEKPMTCTQCGATQGSELRHNWIPANCKDPKTCVRCFLTEGEALGHSYVDGVCSLCKDGLPDMPAEE